MKKITENKALMIIFKVIKIIVTILVAMMLLLVLVQRLSSNNLSIGGYRVFTIVSESMLPKYKIGDVIISKEVKPSEVKVDEDLVYLGNEGDFKDKIVTHKVINIYNQNGVYSYQTKGINNDLYDPIVKQEQIYGVVAYKTIFFSFIGGIMSSILGYYLLFTLIAVLISFQLASLIISKRQRDNDEESIN